MSSCRAEAEEFGRLNGDAFHLIDGNLPVGPIIELCRPRRLMGDYGLGVLNRSALLQVYRYPCHPEGMIAGRRG